MGFIFNFDNNEVVIPVHLKPVNNGTKFKEPKIFPPNIDIKLISDFIIFDLEPDCIIQNINENVIVPNIREWSIIYVKDIRNIKKSIIKTVIRTFTKYSYAESIKLFCDLYEKLNYPYILAHNGYRFDFLILKANIFRYLDNPEAIYSKFKFYDSYMFVKELKIKCKYSNVNIFKKYLKFYKSYNYLIKHQHKSNADCQMLLLWVNAILRDNKL
ncbi:KM727_gp68-like protein [Aratus pisonii nudivirus]|nr:KM727_gp68-like protein [Aratus pisonii nudivirus]